jgi:hypothetical protein
VVETESIMALLCNACVLAGRRNVERQYLGKGDTGGH